MYRDKRERRNGMLVTETICITGIAALMLFNFNGLAFAQNDPQASPRPGVSSTPFPAPIGHVQPTPRDLPPGVAATETERTKAQTDFDKRLQICRNC
jgi:hypothetical protein